MPFLFNRQCVVVFPDLGFQVDALRTQFKIVKNLGPEPNTCEILITNLSDTSRAKMRSKGTKIALLAGYPGTLGQIFAGVTRTIDQRQVGPEWLTKIECGDGEASYEFDRAAFSVKGGSTVWDVVKTIVSGMTVGAGNLGTQQAVLQGIQFVQGYSANGKASGELSKALGAAGLDWSIQDGQIQILGPKALLPGQAIVLSPDAGLIGSPEHGTPNQKTGTSVLKAKSLLQPLLQPGKAVQINGVSNKGVYKIQKVEHQGDTAGGPWYSELECLP